MKKLTSESSDVKLIDNDIVHIKFHENHTSRIEDVKEAYHAYLSLSNNLPAKLLIEIGSGAYFSFDVDKLLNEDTVFPIAEAIVSDSLAIRLIIKYYTYPQEYNRKVRLFNKKESAVKWLNSI